MMYHWMTKRPGLYDDIYMDLTFVDVMEKHGINASARVHAEAYAHAEYDLWHANQQGRYNILNGIDPPESGHWLNNPHADDIDFQIEADFAGIMSPGMPVTAAEICDRVGHIMNYGDGYYGGVMVAAMYSYAFVTDDVGEIVEKALRMIPEQSTYHQCIRDVILWHEEHPSDWRKTWRKIEDKWGVDYGCPDGVLADFNIDAKINSAYVVLGLLYGEGDLARTLEISTRAGQDSDCNPATAGGILGAVIGYDQIPAHWSAGLGLIEDMDFKYTSVSLNDVYDISYKHALDLIFTNFGKIDQDEIAIRVQEPIAVPFEQSFPAYRAKEKQAVNTRVRDAGDVFTTEFDGIGVVVRGRVGHALVDSGEASPEPGSAMFDHQLMAEVYIDDALAKTISLPLSSLRRSPELFFQYELEPGLHRLRIFIMDMADHVYMDIRDVIVYDK
jgi:hypothetical protein